MQYQYGIVDWPEHGRFGYDMTAAARTTVNALGVDVLRKVAPGRRGARSAADEVQAYVADADGARRPDERRRCAGPTAPTSTACSPTARRARTPASTRRRTPSRSASRRTADLPGAR